MRKIERRSEFYHPVAIALWISLRRRPGKANTADIGTPPFCLPKVEWTKREKSQTLLEGEHNYGNGQCGNESRCGETVLRRGRKTPLNCDKVWDKPRHIAEMAAESGTVWQGRGIIAVPQ